MSGKHIAIIGGGIMGVTLAYKLSQAGAKVTVYERSSNLGGLATFMPYNGARIDRFYHTILSSDLTMQTLIREAGVEHRLHFTATKQGFYDNGTLYPFTTPVDLLRFPPLNLLQRIRLGLQIVYAQFDSDWRKMDTIPVEDWLLRVSGQVVFNKVWKPLLRAKFDSAAVNVPATYTWSRLRRMMATRKGVTSKEMMCFLEDGYYTLIEALAKRCEAQGVTFCLSTPIDEIVIENGSARALRIGSHVEAFDAIISTLPSPLLSPLIPNAPAAFHKLLNEQEYLGVLCPLLVLKERLTPYYVLNITDDSIPFTAVVETTNLIDPQYVGGHHLLYLPKYLAPDNPMAQWDDDQVKTEWMRHFRRMFPHYDQRNIEAFIVQRARHVEALRPMGTSDQIPTVAAPIKHLFMSNTAMIYPELSNGEAVTRFATHAVEVVQGAL
jgi:protoporphyrinogen oxidase